MDTNNDDFTAWLAAETEKVNQLIRSPDTWIRKNADNRLDALRATQKVWAEFKATRPPNSPPH